MFPSSYALSPTRDLIIMIVIVVKIPVYLGNRAKRMEAGRGDSLRSIWLSPSFSFHVAFPLWWYPLGSSCEKSLSNPAGRNPWRVDGSQFVVALHSLQPIPQYESSLYQINSCDRYSLNVFLFHSCHLTIKRLVPSCRRRPPIRKEIEKGKIS